jgi:hypothetical protein
MGDVVGAAKAELSRAKDRMAHALASTPDDKINWSPAPSARSAVELAAHGALGIAGLQGMFEGKPFPWANLDEADRVWRVEEAKFTTREQVLELLEKNAAAYNAWLDSLSPEELASTWTLPMGNVPAAYAITFPAYHLQTHAAQIDYIQTILGDRDMHF